MRKVYSECYVFCDVFCEMRKVYSQPDNSHNLTTTRYRFSLVFIRYVQETYFRCKDPLYHSLPYFYKEFFKGTLNTGVKLDLFRARKVVRLLSARP